MIEHIRADSRFSRKDSSLETYHLFSFGEYSDPKNNSFGALRVFNDDRVFPGTGFPLHPHANFEILTIVADGALTHSDSEGNSETISSGNAQRMSAGTGIMHSEFNLSEKPVRLFQIWFSPLKKNVRPSYQTGKGVFRKNSLAPCAVPDSELSTGKKKAKSKVSLNATARVFALELSSGKTISLGKSLTGKTFVYLFSGKASIGKLSLSAGDQARITGEENLPLRGVSGVPKAIVIHL